MRLALADLVGRFGRRGGALEPLHASSAPAGPRRYHADHTLGRYADTASGARLARVGISLPKAQGTRAP